MAFNPALNLFVVYVLVVQINTCKEEQALLGLKLQWSTVNYLSDL
jgi:hypothetical protein